MLNRSGRPHKGEHTASAKLVLRALKDLNREWKESRRFHSDAICRPWSRDQIIRKLLKTGKAHPSKEELKVARQVFDRGMTSAGKRFYNALERDGNDAVRVIWRARQIDDSMKFIFTHRGTYFECKRCGNRRNWMVRSVQQPNNPVSMVTEDPTYFLKDKLSFVTCPECGKELGEKDRAPIEPEDYKQVLQPDGLEGTDMYAYSPDTEPYPPKVSEVYSLEVKVQRLRAQLESLAPAPDPSPQGSKEDEAWNNGSRHWRIVSARGVEDLVHEIEDSLENLKEELKNSLFKETGTVLSTLKAYRKNQLMIPPRSMVTGVRVLVPGLTKNNRTGKWKQARRHRGRRKGSSLLPGSSQRLSGA